MSGEKRIVIIAGPNGAGKTTFAREFLPNEADCPIFVNVDLIAAGLSPFRPELAAVRAGRLMIEGHPRLIDPGPAPRFHSLHYSPFKIHRSVRAGLSSPISRTSLPKEREQPFQLPLARLLAILADLERLGMAYSGPWL